MSHTDETLTAPVTETVAEPDDEAARLTALLDDSPIPALCSDEELAAVDFSLLNVLIGTVRSDAQFEYCKASNSYYIPAKTVAPADLPVSLIANNRMRG